MANDSRITYFGETDFRNQRTRFGIKDIDRLRHMYVIGKTGVGKSTLLENLASQDIMNGNGLAYIDPHGSSAETLLEYIPEHRIKDVVYFAPFDVDYPIGFNVMEDVGPDERHKVANGLLSTFKKIWVDAFSARMEYILGNTILALLEYPDSTLLGVNRLLTDKEYRKKVIDNIKDASVKDFWENDYGKWDDRYRREAGAAIQNKVGQFTTNPLIRNIVGQPKGSFDLEKIINGRKILIANLSKGRLGETNAQLLGGMLNTKIYLGAMSRAGYTLDEQKQLPPFYLYVDEFQNFASESFADILSEARKYKLGLTMAHQYVAQMPDAVREAVIGNVGTLITFRIGPADAELFAQQFAPVFTQEDLANLGFAQVYLSLMIDGMGSKPFSAKTLPPIQKPPITYGSAAIEHSRNTYANKRTDVEAAINKWYEPIPSAKQIAHMEYLAKKRAEVEAAGGVWKDPEGNTLKPLPKPFTSDQVKTTGKKHYVKKKPEAPKKVEEKPKKQTPKPNIKIKTSSKLDGLLNSLEPAKKTEDKQKQNPQITENIIQELDKKQGTPTKIKGRTKEEKNRIKPNDLLNSKIEPKTNQETTPPSPKKVNSRATHTKKDLLPNTESLKTTAKQHSTKNKPNKKQPKPNSNWVKTREANPNTKNSLKDLLSKLKNKAPKKEEKKNEDKPETSKKSEATTQSNSNPNEIPKDVLNKILDN